MGRVTVTLHTGGHCIETAAKNEFRRITELLLSTEDEPVLNESAPKLELLREFIETADFNALRASDERLAGIKPGYCVIGRNTEGVPVAVPADDPVDKRHE